jgi:hypothetical protein
MRESDIHFARWIFVSREKIWRNFFIFSALIHMFLALVIYYLKPKYETVSSENSTIHINFSDLKPKDKNSPSSHEPKVNSQHKITKRILTDPNVNSKSSFSASSQVQKNTIDKQQEIKNTLQKKEHKLKDFLPSGHQNYIENIQNNNQVFENAIQADGGDIPIEGPSLAPKNGPKIVERYVEKDMSLFQFTQEFRERFGAIWNSKDRILPPSSPLRAGDVVYYKVYIKSNGEMEKYENISRSSYPLKNYNATDEFFKEVILKVLPMSVPPKFANKNTILSEVIAIQVVDKDVPTRFAF